MWIQEFPRLGLMKGLKENMLHICKTKPQTTYDNTVGKYAGRNAMNLSIYADPNVR